MAAEPVPGSIEVVSQTLDQLFSAHGVECVWDGSVLRFPAHPDRWADGELFRQFERLIQLDVRIGFDGGRVVCESVTGIGNTLEEQATNAMQSFATSSFHILLSALFETPPCHGTEVEEWVVGGRKRTVFLGTVTSRFKLPTTDGKPDLGFFGEFEARLKEKRLPPGTHWVRLYQMRHNGEAVANEVLLDNAPWPEMQADMARFAWPVSDEYYDVRLFLVIRDPAG